MGSTCGRVESVGRVKALGQCLRAMGCPNVKFLDVEPFELSFRTFVLGGFWPLETDVRWKQIAFSIFSYVCYFSVTSMVVIQMLDLFLLRHDVDKLLKDLCIISCSFVIVAKGHFILHKIDEINALRKQFVTYKNTRTDPEDVRILDHSNKQIAYISRLTGVAVLICITYWVIFPLLQNSERQLLPFPYRLPTDEWSDAVYYTLYVYQALSILGYALNFLSVDSIFCGFILRINAHYDIVIKNLKALGTEEDEAPIELETEETLDEEAKARETETVLNIIKENIQLHQKILKQIESLQDIYNSSSFVYFVGVTTVFATAIFDLAKISDEFRLQLLQRMLYVMIALWDTFLYCYFASLLHHKSIELSLAAYEARWYNLKPEVRPYLQFISMKCQKVPKITVANLFALELKTFLNIIKISYDVTALLYQTNRKRS